jgi:uncharacterized Zn finger protein
MKRETCPACDVADAAEHLIETDTGRLVSCRSCGAVTEVVTPEPADFEFVDTIHELRAVKQDRLSYHPRARLNAAQNNLPADMPDNTEDN